MPKLNNPSLSWSSDPRYLFVREGDKLYVVDMIAKSIEEILGDWDRAINFGTSPSGEKVVYVTGGNNKQVKVQNLLEHTNSVIENLSGEGVSGVVWLDNTSILVIQNDGTFKKVELDTGKQSFIPYVGATLGKIKEVSYSWLGKTLLVVADGGIYTMAL